MTSRSGRLGLWTAPSSYPDGKCATEGAPAAKANTQLVQNATSGAAPAGKPGVGSSYWSEQNSDRPTPPSSFMPILLSSLVALAIFKPKLLRKIFGHVEPLEIDRGKLEIECSKSHWADVSEEELLARSERLVRSEQLKWRTPPPNTPHSVPVFGRRRA